MQPPPKHLVDGVPDVELEYILEWGSSLGNLERERIATLCDERHESCFFGVLGEEPLRLKAVIFCQTTIPWIKSVVGMRTASTITPIIPNW